MTTFTKTLTTAAILAVTLSGGAWAAELTLKFQSSDPAGNPNFELQTAWANSIEERTGGKVAIELLPVESIVAYNETQDAIAAGILDGHITDVSYFSGRDPAFGLIGNPVGAWSDPQQMFDFINDGGGRELMNELENPYGLEFIGATTPGLEAFVSKVPLYGVADLKGLKLRAPEGLIQNVFAAAGASPVNLPGSEVFTSLDKGVIDAADYSVFNKRSAGPARRGHLSSLSRLSLDATGRSLDEQGKMGWAGRRNPRYLDRICQRVRFDTGFGLGCK